MIEKLKTLAWFARRPLFWGHMLALARRRLDGSGRHEAKAAEAVQWAAQLAVPVDTALHRLGVVATGAVPPDGVPTQLIEDARLRLGENGAGMGGAGDIDLIHRAIRATGARRVLETGVAAGWSSLAALSALQHTEGRLVSVDMPYPKAGTEHLVGMAVPDFLRARWTLFRLPDRSGIGKALAILGGEIDLVHYDSDKSYAGRAWAYPRLWAALAPGGLFISDDIQDNFGFRDFVMRLDQPFAVVESQGKHVGIIRKPQAGLTGASGEATAT